MRALARDKMIAFIIINILIISLLAGAVIDYFKLKKHIPKDQKKDPEASIQIPDVLFNQSLIELEREVII